MVKPSYSWCDSKVIIFLSRIDTLNRVLTESIIVTVTRRCDGCAGERSPPLGFLSSTWTKLPRVSMSTQKTFSWNWNLEIHLFKLIYRLFVFANMGSDTTTHPVHRDHKFTPHFIVDILRPEARHTCQEAVTRVTNRDNDGDRERNRNKKMRTTFTGRQIFIMEKMFETKKYLNASERSHLSRLY